MLLVALAFVVAAGGVICLYLAGSSLLAWHAERQMEQRLREISGPGGDGGEDGDESSTLVVKPAEGPLPGVERLMAQTEAGSSLARLIEQAGVATTPSTIVITSVGLTAVAAVLTFIVSGSPLGAAATGLAAAASPFLWLRYRRSQRLKRFEEQFPEALDLLSRAIRAGHAFQSAMGMVADELPAPVGAEFKKAFDQQNFGLPVREALLELATRVPSLDVRFFVTAVTIQRETGGNLSEILDNLARVVRERFKIRRQVRVHTAHGRFTGYVLLALPAALALVLTWLSPEHMKLLFTERIGQTLLIGAMVMQAIGFVWIRQVIKIEV
jgi:tight adherence protein B